MKVRKRITPTRSTHACTYKSFSGHFPIVGHWIDTQGGALIRCTKNRFHVREDFPVAWKSIPFAEKGKKRARIEYASSIDAQERERRLENYIESFDEG